MRTPSRLLRSATLLLALLSVVVLGSARDAACEMHGLGDMASHAVAGHHGGDRSAPMDAPAGTSLHRHGGTDGDTPDDAGTCCCIGTCSAAVTVARAPVTPTLLVAFVAAQPRRVFDARSAQAAPSEPDRLLPFANGPPAGRLL